MSKKTILSWQPSFEQRVANLVISLTCIISCILVCHYGYQGTNVSITLGPAPTSTKV